MRGKIWDVGFNLSLIAYADDGELDLGQPSIHLDACPQVVKTIFPRSALTDVGEVALDVGAFPAREDVNVGVFKGGVLVATRDAALFNPTKLAPRYLKPALGRSVTLVTQQSAYDMFAYARWVDGHLLRSISVNPVGKVWESIGPPEPFEAPCWEGLHPAARDYPLPFHPLDMSDAALRAVLRLHFEGRPGHDLVDPSTVKLRSFQRNAR